MNLNTVQVSYDAVDGTENFVVLVNFNGKEDKIEDRNICREKGQSIDDHVADHIASSSSRRR